MTLESLTPEFVERLAKIAEAATPGPWEQFQGELEGNPYWTPRTISAAGCRVATTNELVMDDEAFANAAHIAAFNPALCSALLAERAGLLAEVVRLREALTPFAALELDDAPEGALVYVQLRTKGPCHLTPADFRRAGSALERSNA